VFKPLEKQHILKIIDINIANLRNRLKHMNINFEIDQSAKEFLADKGYDENFGARPLKRAIQKYLEDPMSEEILKGTFKEHSNILITHRDDEEQLHFEDIGSHETDGLKDEHHEELKDHQN